jgi:hypothetical protein
MTEHPAAANGELRSWRRVAIAAAIGLVIGLGGWLAARALGEHPPAELFTGVPTSCLVLLELIRATIPDLVPLAPEPPRLAERSEHVIALRELERRLEAASKDPSRFDRNVRPLLVRLATDRLRLRHGVDPRREPSRSRELMGEDLWHVMTSPWGLASSAPSQAQLAALVKSIEQI